MEKNWRWVALTLFLIWIVGVGTVAGLRLRLPPDLASNPLEPRDGAEFRSGYLGVLESSARGRQDDFPATKVMNTPARVAGKSPEHYLLDWNGEPEMRKEPQPERWVEGLLGDDAIELVAFASWVPRSEDDLTGGSNWSVQPNFRAASSGEVMDGMALDRLGVPAAFREMKPNVSYHTPKLRLLFRVENMKHVRFVAGVGGDLQTGSVVTYNLDSLGEVGPHFGRQGEWAFYDMALLIWHDVPMKFHLQVLTGEPETKELPRELGAQLVFADALRVQWLGESADEFDVIGRLGGFDFSPSMNAEEKAAMEKRTTGSYGSDPNLAYIRTLTSDPGDRPSNLFRVNSKSYLNSHCGLVVSSQGDIDWDWINERESGQMYFASRTGTAPPGGPLKLVFLPKVTELVFEIPGLPDQPNARDVEDLFDITLPRITLPEDSETAEDHLLGLASVAAEVEFDIDNLWDDEVPDNFPADRTFRNLTPRELLHWYLKATPNSRIRYDEEENLIFFNEEKDSWWTSFTEWIRYREWF